jgi:chromosome segregation ATPase
VAAPLTEAQQATKDAEDKKKRDLAEAGEKQRLADQALLSTYADEKDLDTARDRAVGEMERSVKSAEVNLVELNKTKASLAAEAAALKGQPQPFQLKRKIERNQMALTEQQATLEVKKKDMEETQAKFEGFRKRLKELKSTDTAVKPDSP